jgi:glycosyltransferase involved in cell wall biosynthesis
MNKTRLHLLAIPHTITSDEFSHCAFTGKVQRFSMMMISRGFEVYHYGVETSESRATEDIILLTKEEWNDLRIKSLMTLKPEFATIEKSADYINNKSNFIGELANVETELYKVFNERARLEIEKNYRDVKSDIVCLPFGIAHASAVIGKNYVVVETGIGYSGSYKNYRIFESYAWLNNTLGNEKKPPQNYWFVIPNYYNTLEFHLNLKPEKIIGFFGRISETKGCHIISEIAKHFSTTQFILCGQGDPTPFLTSGNIKYKEPIYGSQRSEYLGSLTAIITPSQYLEPFCGVNVEAQLCGTPVISVDSGGFAETIEPFKTGLLCHSLADFCYAIDLALKGFFDRQYIYDRAVKKYDMYEIAKQYEYVFKSIQEIHNGNNGWYSSNSFMSLLQPN